MPPVAPAPMVWRSVSRNPRSVSGRGPQASEPATPPVAEAPRLVGQQAAPAHLRRDAVPGMAPGEAAAEVEPEARLRVAAVMAHSDLQARRERAAAERQSAPAPFEAQPQPPRSCTHPSRRGRRKLQTARGRHQERHVRIATGRGRAKGQPISGREEEAASPPRNIKKDTIHGNRTRAGRAGDDASRAPPPEHKRPGEAPLSPINTFTVPDIGEARYTTPYVRDFTLLKDKFHPS